MSDELPLTRRALRYVVDSLHLVRVREAYEHPVQKHPSDDAMATVGSVLGRKRGSMQTWTGADGTYIRVAWDRHNPLRIIHVSPPGGDPS